MLKTVFFDGAGTLFHTREPAGLSYARIAGRHGLRADERMVIDSFRRVFAAAPGLAFGPGHEASRLRELEREWWRRLVRSTFAAIGEFPDFDAYFNELFAFFADPGNWTRDPDAAVLLGVLSESGLRLGVISNFDHRIYRILDTLGLSRFFDSVTISSEAGYAKPSAEIFRLALERHAVGAAQALHVGDSEPLDVAGARAAGLAVVLIDPESPPGGGAPRHAAQAADALSAGATPSCGERCIRVRSLGEVAAVLGRFEFA